MRVALLGLVAALVTAACEAPATAVVAPIAAPASGGYAEELAAAEASVRELQQRIAAGPVVWPQYSTLAEAQRALAQLSGDYRHYLAAEQSLAKAFELAGRGGPYLERARFNLSVHRLDHVDADLENAAREGDPDVTAITALRADLAFYRGQYSAALAGYRAALARREDVPGLVRLALWHAHMGHASEAAALFDRAEAIDYGDSPHSRAFIALQRGLMALDRGRWDRALAHYEHALRLLPGWWLAREHIAEIHALQGEHDTAIAEYRVVIRDTGSPEFMDALATLLQQRGDEAAAAEWIARARKLYEERLATLPETTYGHGLNHFLEFGSADEALVLARRNHALRPYGESQTQLIAALLRKGETAEALRLSRSALASGWQSAALHSAAAQAFAAAGLEREAAAETAAAKALNPRAAEQYGLPVADPVVAQRRSRSSR